MRAPPKPQPDWAYFLDIDGTLLDIAERPEAIRVDGELRALVERAFVACGGALALISGRSLADVERRLAGVLIPAAGQHGIERRDAAGDLHSGSAAPPAMQELRARLASLVERHPGLLLEDKGLSLALHYRQAPRLAAYLHRILPRLAAEVGDDVMVQKGKRVLEIRPGGIDKGTAVEAFLAEMPYRGRRPVFIGDDITDEPGFAVANRWAGVSIKVGGGASRARYRLSDAAAVRAWLETMAGASP